MIQQSQSFHLHIITPTLINLRVLKVTEDLKDPKDYKDPKAHKKS